MADPARLKAQTCCFSGHRCLCDPPELIKQRLEQSILLLAQNGVRYFGAGGARGFDLLAAQAVLCCKAKGAPVKLILVLPFWGQQTRWSQQEQRIFETVLQGADKVVCLHPETEGDKVQFYKERNRHLVDNSDYLLCYAVDYNSGTGYSVGRAYRSGVKIANLAQEDFIQTIQEWFLPKEEMK